MQWKSVRECRWWNSDNGVCGLLVAASSMGPTARANNEDKMVCTDKPFRAITEPKLKVRSSAPICTFRGLASLTTTAKAISRR